MIDPNQFRQYVIRPTLQRLELWSVSAENLLLGTALIESYLRYVKQINGPALGFYQMEPSTEVDIHINYLKYRPFLRDKISTLGQEDLILNLAYSTAMCRLHYYRVSDPLPNASDSVEMSRYWKKFYNTELGKGSEIEFQKRFDRHVI